jgi:hypothetical protein
MAAPTAAHRGNDGALGASGDMRLEAGFANALNNVFDLLFGSAIGHVYNHCEAPSIRPLKAKAAM